MRRKVCLLAIFLASLILAGCETSKGLTQDTKNLWNNLKKFDDWFQEHYW